MIEVIILGAIQGIAEWLPVSSEGMVVLVQTVFFDEANFSALVSFAIWLHVGTFFAALVYFWKDVVRLVRGLFCYKKSRKETQSLLRFLIISTLISGGIGFALLKGLEGLLEGIGAQVFWIVMLVGVSLLITGYLQLTKKVKGIRKEGELCTKDAVILGIVQGFAIVPGLSRSGLTVAALLLRKFHDVSALRLSFLMSMPIVLGANIVLQAGELSITKESLIGLFVAFVLGLATIHGLMIFARKVNVGLFVLLFGILTIASAFIL